VNIIVTGGRGFIGHHVVAHLKQLGHQCHVIDNDTDYGFVPAAEAQHLRQERQKIASQSDDTQWDICSPDTRRYWAHDHRGKIDIIIHLASFPRQKVVERDPVLASKVMSTGLINLLELAREIPVQRFVYVSSSMVYGDFDCGVTEDSQCRPQGQYGIMKLMGEYLVQDYSRQGAFEHVIVRPSAVYGQRDVDDRIVSKFMLAALRGQTLLVRGPEEILDFTHVSDTAAGIVAAALQPAAADQTFNITRNEPEAWTIQAAAELCISLAGRGRIDVLDRDRSFPRRGRLNSDRARSLLNWHPAIDVIDGFEAYMQWFRDDSYWRSQI